MKTYILAGAVALVLLSASGAVAEDTPLIPDCYVANQSQSEFRDCVRGAGGTDAVRPPSDDQTSHSADAAEAPSAIHPDAPPPPAGMRQREHREMATDEARASSDTYAGLPEPPADAEDGPARYSDTDAPQADMDGPRWGSPYSDEPDGGGPSGFGPPPGDDWPGGQMERDGGGPPDDGPGFDF